MILRVDIETYSPENIKTAGLYKYASNPAFEILLIAYCYDDSAVTVIDLTAESLPNQLRRDLLNTKIEKWAYNAAFECFCLARLLQLDPAEWIYQWRCTMIHGLYLSYPAGLEALGKALGLPEDKRKLNTGKSLIRTFCTPAKPSKANGQQTRILPHHEPEKWKLFKEYNAWDVETEREIARRLEPFPVPDDIWQQWIIDQIINMRGVAVERKLIQGAMQVDCQIRSELLQEAAKISGLANPNSVAQIKTWLEHETGAPVDSLDKQIVETLLASTEDEKVRRLLSIRQLLGKTSVKKYEAMQNALCEDNRIRGLLQFYGANRTGRWAGRLVQVHNLPRNYMTTLALARRLVLQQKTEQLRVLYQNVPDTLSQLIRTAFIAPTGKKLIAADFSAIEARVIAWLAGEEWRQEVFATHGKIYEASAAAMFHVPIELIKKGNPEYELRQKGKIAELALGYGGGPGALISMGALDKGLAEDELPDIVSRWRQANKKIVGLWRAVEAAAITAMETGLAWGLPDRKLIVFRREARFNNGLDFLTVTLPSGRKMFYALPYLAPNRFLSNSLHYIGLNQTTKTWGPLETYGGKLVENIVQAIARDCLTESILLLNQQGYKIVFHIHDEVVIEADPEQSVETVCELMGRNIAWAPGLILRADGFETPYYKKE